MEVQEIKLEDIKPDMKVRLRWPDIWVYYVNEIVDGKIIIRSTIEYNDPDYLEKTVELSEIRIIN